MTADAFLTSMTQGAMSSAYQALRATQADVANARARGPASAPAPPGYGDPNSQMSPEMVWMMQQQQMMMMQMYQQNQAMMNMMMMVMSGGLQNPNQYLYQTAYQTPNPFVYQTPYQDPLYALTNQLGLLASQGQMNQLPSDQQDQVQQVMLSLLLKLQIAMSQIGAFTGEGNQNTVYNSELGMIRADLPEEAQTALVTLKNEVSKVSMSSANINEAVSAALAAGANPNDVYQAVRNGYNKDEQLPLSRFYAAMAQPTRTSDLALQELYNTLSQKAASGETPDNYSGLFV